MCHSCFDSGCLLDEPHVLPCLENASHTNLAANMRTLASSQCSSQFICLVAESSYYAVPINARCCGPYACSCLSTWCLVLNPHVFSLAPDHASPYPRHPPYGSISFTLYTHWLFSVPDRTLKVFPPMFASCFSLITNQLCTGTDGSLECI